MNPQYEKNSSFVKMLSCKHCNNRFCNVLTHFILSGFAADNHCKDCKEYVKRGEEDKNGKSI